MPGEAVLGPGQVPGESVGFWRLELSWSPEGPWGEMEEGDREAREERLDDRRTDGSGGICTEDELSRSGDSVEDDTINQEGTHPFPLIILRKKSK